jgi:hypothetical protein
MGCTLEPILNPFTGQLQLINGTNGGGPFVRPIVVLAKAKATAVPVSTKTTVVTLTASTITYITNVICSGMEYGKWYLVIDSADEAIRRGGPARDVVWDFVNPLTLNAASVLDVKVEHFVTGQTPDFESTIMGYVG